MLCKTLLSILNISNIKFFLSVKVYDIWSHGKEALSLICQLMCNDLKKMSTNYLIFFLQSCKGSLCGYYIQ